MCSSDLTTEGHTLFIEPYYDSDEMMQIPGRVDIIRRMPDFRDYIYPAYRELLEVSDRVVISGTAILDHTVAQVTELAKELKKDVILWGPDVPITPILSQFGVTEICGFVVDEVYDCMMFARAAMNRDRFLPSGHFAGLHL